MCMWFCCGRLGRSPGDILDSRQRGFGQAESGSSRWESGGVARAVQRLFGDGDELGWDQVIYRLHWDFFL
jgi:hypothetical protein